MTHAGEFSRGDCVVSPAGFQGVVTRVDAGVVYVEYRGEKGRVTRGVYDAAWFERWPTMLQNLGAGAWASRAAVRA